MEGMIPPPPPPRYVGKYPPPPPFKPAAGLPNTLPPPPPRVAPTIDVEAPPGVILEEQPVGQEGVQQEYDPNALPTSFGAPTMGHDPYAPQQQEEEEQHYVQPEYNVHPMLRNDGGYKPYKRKAESSSSLSSNDDDDIRPNLALYQQRKPEPYVPPSHKRVLPSREEESVGTYSYKKNPFEQPSAFPSSAKGMGGDRGSRGAGEERSGDGVVGVAPYKRRTFSVEESREKKKQQQESATNITNSVVASIREKLASGGKISKGQAKILNRDQEIVSSIAMPTYVSHRTGSGLTPEQIQKAQDEHTRKLLGWKYHVAVKARNEQALQTKRQKK
eukprot:Phypoly_transcript_12677.p1 GENE.Phypoly_transcript_12677~~Phypoly_transcript_12677.p1  ORF type:complete len:361 (+),score=99.36 Phypoly_transcript_12677:93-1085(+)